MTQNMLEAYPLQREGQRGGLSGTCQWQSQRWRRACPWETDHVFLELAIKLLTPFTRCP